MQFDMIVRCFVFAVMSLGSTAAFGQSLDTGDTAWMSMSTVLVLFMTIPGLALFYAGMVSASSAERVLLQCFAITCLVTILWFAIGYSLAFGNSLIVVGDLSRVFYNGIGEDVLWGTIPESLFAMFQLTFAIITPALLVGALVERVRMSVVLLFTALWSVLVYAPVAHWVWGGGWLGNLGVLDFAGGLVVHTTAGTAAFVIAIALPPRRGFPDRIPPPHNMPLTVAGAAMLWVGWLGFNGGSALAANGDAAMAMTTTQLAAAAAALTWMTIEWLGSGKPSAPGAVTGMVAGLAAVTPAAGSVGPAGALVIGTSAGALCLIAARVLKNMLKIDDSLDVVSAHMVGGILGTIAVGVLASSGLGVLSGQEDISIPRQVSVQVIAVAVTVAYTGVVTWGILVIVKVAVSTAVRLEMRRSGKA